MKFIGLCFTSALSFLTNILSAQDFPDYGKISGTERTMKECSFDKKADAVVLLDEAYSNYDDNNKLVLYRHTRIKILTEKGIEEGNINLPYYSKDEMEFIDEIEGQVLNIDANGSESLQELNRKTIYDQKKNQYYSEISFAFPAVKVGSILEYKYRMVAKHIEPNEWYFQTELPVVKSSYKLVIFPRAEFAYQVRKSPDYPIDIKPQPELGMISFAMQNIPGLKEEPYMDARKDYLQRVTFQISAYSSSYGKERVSTTWEEFGRELGSASYLGGQMDKTLPGTEDLIKKVAALPTPLERMNSVYEYVRKSMSWSGMHSFGASDGIKTPWNKKNGNSGEINLILINLLKAVGLDVNPILVSERANGKVNTEYPFLDQFNNVYAYVKIDGRSFFLDATDPFTPPHLIPSDILNTTGFVVSRKKGVGGLLQIINDSLGYKENMAMNLVVSKDQTITGKVTVSSSDYARVDKMAGLSKGKQKLIEKYYHSGKYNWVVKDIDVENEDKDQLPLEQKFEFSGPLGANGDYLFIPLNIFTGFETNPFQGDYRFTNINFGYKKLITVNLTIDLPSDFMVDGIPRPLKLINSDNNIVFTRVIQFEKSTQQVLCKLTFEFKKSLYLADEYGVVKDFYKKMFQFLDENIVLKKK